MDANGPTSDLAVLKRALGRLSTTSSTLRKGFMQGYLAEMLGLDETGSWSWNRRMQSPREDNERAADA